MRPTITVHGAIRCLMVAIFGILVYQVTAASLRPPISVRVYGSQHVATGQTAFYRISCLDTDGLTPCQTPDVVAQFVTKGPDGKLAPIGPAEHANAEGGVRLDVPRPLPEHSGLSVRVRDGKRTPTDSVFVEVAEAAAGQPVPGRIVAPLLLRCVPSQDIVAELWPDDGVVIDGLVASGRGRWRP